MAHILNYLILADLKSPCRCLETYFPILWISKKVTGTSKKYVIYSRIHMQKQMKIIQSGENLTLSWPYFKIRNIEANSMWKVSMKLIFGPLCIIVMTLID